LYGYPFQITVYELYNPEPRTKQLKPQNKGGERRCMSSIPIDVLTRISTLQGYERQLEVASVAQQYGMAPEEVESIASRFAKGTPQPSMAGFQPVTSKEVPQIPTQAQHINVDQMRFQYDPTDGAKERRAQVEQAILCPACGVALGIPSQRPIKVTCPQCLHEAMFQ
jgi:hypothetical protein